MAVSWSDGGARTGPQEIGLIAKVAARKDDEAARRLYRKYHEELFRFGCHVLHDQGLAEEMVQETFIKFCRQASNYDAKRGPVRGWLFTMARSAAYDIARRPSSRPFGTVRSRSAKAAGTLRAELASPRGSDDAFGAGHQAGLSRGLRLRIRQLPLAKWAGFSRHLTGCHYCQGIIDEYSQIGGITKNLPRTSSPLLTSKTVRSPRWPRGAAAGGEGRR